MATGLDRPEMSDRRPAKTDRVRAGRLVGGGARWRARRRARKLIERLHF